MVANRNIDTVIVPRFRLSFRKCIPSSESITSSPSITTTTGSMGSQSTHGPSSDGVMESGHSEHCRAVLPCGHSPNISPPGHALLSAHLKTEKGRRRGPIIRLQERVNSCTGLHVGAPSACHEPYPQWTRGQSSALHRPRSWLPPLPPHCWRHLCQTGYLRMARSC